MEKLRTKSNVWDRRIVVELTVRELAALFTTMGNMTDERIIQDFEEDFGPDARVDSKIDNFDSYGLYNDMQEILKEEGVKTRF